MITIDIGFDPVLAQIGPFQLGWHGIFTALAVAGGVWLALRLGARRGISPELVSTVATWAVVGGIIGARLFHVLDHLPQYAQDPLSALAVWQGGIAVYGAFIGGVVAGGFAAWRAKADPWPLLDIAAPAMLVGQAIGRLGCLSNGDAWGADATGLRLLWRFGTRTRTICCRRLSSGCRRTPTRCMRSLPSLCCWSSCGWHEIACDSASRRLNGATINGIARGGLPDPWELRCSASVLRLKFVV